MSSTAAARALALDPMAVEHAVLRTVAYSDVFDYPLRSDEVHSWLHGLPAPAELTGEVLEWCRTRRRLVSREGFYALPGRERIAELRLERAERARELWPVALWYASLLAELPFVRMVAITGSLAWENVGEDADVDFLVVTEQGRLWIPRLQSAALTRSVGAPKLCANYWLSERALTLTERDLFTAYELTRMIPIEGTETYGLMRALNAWTAHYFPNAQEPPSPTTLPRGPETSVARALVGVARAAGPLLRTPLGTAVEAVEMRWRGRKIRRNNPSASETDVRWGPDYFKSHPRSRLRPTLVSFESRLRALGVPAA